jgi:hypothetical protein
MCFTEKFTAVWDGSMYQNICFLSPALPVLVADTIN